MKFVTVPILALLGACAVSSASAQTAASCLIVSNAWFTPTKDKKISLEVDGHPNEFWATTFNQSILVAHNGVPIQGSNFTIHLFDGVDGPSGASIETGSSAQRIYPAHQVWTYVKTGNDLLNGHPECDGAWLVLIHDTP